MAIQVSFFETYTSHDLLGFYTLSACSASCPAVVMWWFTSQAFLVFTSAVSRLCLYPCSSSTVTWECTRGDAVWLLPLRSSDSPCAVSMLLLALSSFGYQFSPWLTSAWLQRSPTDFHLLDHLLLLPLYLFYLLAFCGFLPFSLHTAVHPILKNTADSIYYLAITAAPFFCH